MSEEFVQGAGFVAPAPITITGVRSRVVKVPIKKKVVSRVGIFESMWFVLVDVETDAGITGSTYLWAFSSAGAAAIQKVLVELAEVAVGEDPFCSARLWKKMRSRITQWGHKGLSIVGLSGIDTVVWDIVGKALNRPLAQVLGGTTDPIPTYASEGLWLTEDLHALTREAEELVEGGFKAVKMRLGRARMADDVEAVRAVRQTIGPDITLMVDSNQGWDVNYTIRIGRKLEAFDLYWIEEPIRHDDLAGHRQIAQALDTALASGENVYTPHGFREAIEQQAFDILMPDLERVGGVTGWMRTAALAEAWNLPICSHLFPEMSVHLLAASPTACFLEHMPWGGSLFQEQLELVDGKIRVPNRPGYGFSWDEGAVRHFMDLAG
ncbi:MAG: mandelate racemase/muconate lactonizing enzyme family protein [Chloroflexi bacterium]|nr:mandelate racemase/muconate lactonizing enzyme family protein [Chloroflexota bacterium]